MSSENRVGSQAQPMMIEVQLQSAEGVTAWISGMEYMDKDVVGQIQVADHTNSDLDWTLCPVSYHDDNTNR
jgi:hypothetical protein